MVKTAIFASGSGTNFENLVLRMQDGTIPNAVCELLVVDKENAKARERADRLGIDHIYVNPKAYAGKKEYEQEIRRHLEEKGVQLITPEDDVIFHVADYAKTEDEDTEEEAEA